MKIKGKLTPAILVLLLAFLAFILLAYITNPGMLYRYGLSYGIRWQLPFSSSGHILRETLTRKTWGLESKTFYAAGGDQVVLSREVEVEQGYVYTSLWKVRLWPPKQMVWQEILYESTSDTVSIEIEDSGFYHFSFHIHKFMGAVDLAWDRNPE